MISIPTYTRAIAFVLLSVLASQSFALDPFSWDDDNRFFQDNEYRSSAWEEDFGIEGRHFRAWGENTNEPWLVDWLYLELDQTAGGWDTTIARNSPVGKKVDQTSTYRVVGYEYDFTELRTSRSGAWWSGAKVVFFKEDQWEDGDNLVGSYECYVVENSNLSAKQLKKRFGLKYKGKHMVWGRTYKQYTATINGINQVWAIRSNVPIVPAVSHGYNGDPRLYIPVGQMKKHWRKKRYVKHNYYPLGWMAFVETQGRNYGADDVDRTIGGFWNLWLPFND